MEQLLKNLMNEGFSISLYPCVEDQDSYFVDMKMNGKRAYFSIKKARTEEFRNIIEVTIEQLAKTIRQNGKST